MIITLGGSCRFAKEFERWEWELTLAGHSVFGLLGKRPEDLPAIIKDTIDLVHNRKIAASDVLVVIDRGPEMANGEKYTGESTKKYISTAYMLERPIYLTSDFLDPVYLIEKLGGGM